MYTAQSSKAFVEEFTLSPKSSGSLDQLTFALKDLIDVEGHITGGGTPSWAERQIPAVCHALCVEQLLSGGAILKGKTVSDELAFSLTGENHFFGTPLNPKAPDHVPGGSSSGSASAVACGLVDFALGTDTGGSVSVPASNCGIWGYRPSHGLISLAGVLPFAPSFDTVGILARDGRTLQKVALHLLGKKNSPKRNVHLLAPEELQEIASIEGVEKTTELGFDPIALGETYRLLQCSEIWSTWGNWIEQEKPHLGPITESEFVYAKKFDRQLIQQAVQDREEFSQRINHFLGEDRILCYPTTPYTAPLLGLKDFPEDYYPKTLGRCAIAGLARLPHVTIPLLSVGEVPLGISLVAGYDQDDLLLDTALSFPYR